MKTGARTRDGKDCIHHREDVLGVGVGACSVLPCGPERLQSDSGMAFPYGRGVEVDLRNARLAPDYRRLLLVPSAAPRWCSRFGGGAADVPGILNDLKSNLEAAIACSRHQLGSTDQ